MKLFHFLKALRLRSANNGQVVRKLNAKEQLAAQIDAWVNEGGSTGLWRYETPDYFGC